MAHLSATAVKQIEEIIARPSLAIPPIEKTKQLYASIIEEVSKMLYLNICGFPKDRKMVLIASATIINSDGKPCQDNPPKTAIITAKPIAIAVFSFVPSFKK